jgi:hypothetical protein
MSRCVRWCVIAAVVWTLAAASGCGPDGPLYEVSGKASYSGKPVANLVIHFTEKSNNSKSSGVTDNEGRFKLMHSSGKPGAEAGVYQVWLTLPTSAKEVEATRMNPPTRKDPNLAFMLQKYGVASKTPMTVEIKGHQDLKLDF